jgi:hypothetical protein
MQARNNEREKRPAPFRHRPLGQAQALTARNCPYLREGPKRLLARWPASIALPRFPTQLTGGVLTISA